MAAGALGAGALGLLHAAVAGAVVLGGLGLAVPGLVEVEGPAEAAAQAVALGLGCLRVPLESGELHGTFAPLTGLLVTLWGLSSAARKSMPRWGGSRGARVAATAAGFGAACTIGAAVAGSATTVDASVPGAAAAGLVWGALAGAWSTRPADRPAPEWAPPALTTVLVAASLAGVWFLVALVLRLAGLPLRELAGGLVLGIAAAPNAVVALVAIGLGASVDVTLAGTALTDPLTESLALWDWGSAGAAPVYVLVLALVPAVATIAGGRVAAPGPTFVRGLRNGVLFGLVLVVLGWTGSLGAASEAAGDRVAIRFGFDAVTAFASAVAWGVAGAFLAELRSRSRVGPP